MSTVVGRRPLMYRGWFVASAALLIVAGYLSVGFLPRALAHETAAASRLMGKSASAPKVGPPKAGSGIPMKMTGKLQAAANAAVTYAVLQGWASGIAIIDTQTGATTTAGSSTAMFPAESTMKLFIATNLLYTGQMSGSIQSTAYQMVTASDDDAADELYGAVGEDDLESTIAAHYGINNLGTPPILEPGAWGSTQVTPLGMATFLVKAKADPAVGPWLITAMQNTTSIAADGTDQNFGLKTADPTAAVKQGWGGDTADGNSVGTPSIGYVADGRYAIAIYTNQESETSQNLAAQIVSLQARILMPGGVLPPL